MKSRAVLITDAERSQADQLRSRQIRYASMMGLRIVCLVLATVLVMNEAPLLWLWLPLCLAGMVLLPWMAVLIANDRPPKKEHTLRGKLAQRHAAHEALAPTSTTEVTAIPEGGRIVDQDE
ncbi:hypothetical protein Lfu02_46670 [Longispora fulva]|uniref:DUF3099 domain-containing protein n=1 Tax=Longispora fulva TaxID=619741 RepID=A0A8J7KR04_9ACTN|nr:DUF3099 domain-containing protein [Longispora fulva]MBG6138042.1 hypothetical protein [Longispora fulva]GIG60295.1 hypothetical protein Lfu02_46670 [Longispora fulva]